MPLVKPSGNIFFLSYKFFFSFFEISNSIFWTLKVVESCKWNNQIVPCKIGFTRLIKKVE